MIFVTKLIISTHVIIEAHKLANKFVFCISYTPSPFFNNNAGPYICFRTD